MANINYNCIYCGNIFHDVEDLKNHLDIMHPKINPTDKKEIIKDFEKSLRRAKLKYKEKQSRVRQHEIAVSNKQVFKNYQSQIISFLRKINSKSEYENIVLESKNFRKLRSKIQTNFDKETILKLEKEGFKTKNPRKRKKTKSKIIKNYFDKGMNSIKAILTPMGNKR